jgi:hypothetical protein
MTRTPSLGKGTVRCHEPRQHRCNELDGIADWLPAFTPKDFRIGDKIAMDCRGQFDCNLYWLIIRQRRDLQPCHNSSSSVRFEHEIAIDDHADRKPRSNCQRRLDIEVPTDHLLSGLIQRIRSA